MEKNAKNAKNAKTAKNAKNAKNAMFFSKECKERNVLLQRT